MDINLGRITVSRKTLTMLDTRRKSMVEQRKQRKSQLNQFNGNMSSGQQFSDFNRHSENTTQFHRNSMGQQPPQYHVESDYGIDNAGFELTSLDDDFNIRNRVVVQPNRGVTFA